MESILSALYHGQIQPDETIVPSHPEYRPLGRQIGAMKEQWSSRLDEEMYRELEEYFDLCDSMDSIQVEAAFIHGFKLGANMIIEVMSRREDLVSNAASGLSL